MYRHFFKRFLDIILSALALIILSPVYLVLAILVRAKLGSPVIFKQQRPGRIDKKTGKERIFTLYKFRSMTDKRDSKGNLLPDSERLTKFGKALRSTSLDELPEIWNILKGEMSVVGNRPLPLYEAELLTTDDYVKRFMAPAGLTGLWQVEKRGQAGSVSPEERKKLDIEYAESFNLMLDIKIIFRTFTSFIQKENV